MKRNGAESRCRNEASVDLLFVLGILGLSSNVCISAWQDMNVTCRLEPLLHVSPPTVLGGIAEPKDAT